ncbi:MAG TPA: exodeoxyribonuclease VII large subunit [Candidatus Copromorpha excrementipullorum]|uniref:Exodeoxyribonuclease 7 large subunit n=1 Tax=Candidatus Allocopromorpha excrementipullorum TaxID=2840743 RepID=A0A9D1N6I4_9FIRM|nr:exodeoxyribonuclease VII large subunit [Candidatus Copromorpha excrementipullorum]
MAMKPISVSQLNNYIKRTLQTDPLLGNVSVTGEISNLKFHDSGHVYFSLKDESSRINCFIASDNLMTLGCMPSEGMEVVIGGYIYLYMRGGSYSLNVRTMEESGQGELAAAFEKLKRKLEAEGLFDKERKREIPLFPGKIALVTSPTGAAVRDMIKIITGKNDFVDILICPVLVQGPNAAGEIAAAIDDLNKNHPDVDVIIAGRGGGSMEELWAFNEEIVARSIYASHIPVISAVGHEIDFTISDFVADMRAETPTAAAERAAPDTGGIRGQLETMEQEMKHRLTAIAREKRRMLEALDPEVFGRNLKSRIAFDRLNADNIMSDAESRMRSMLTTLRHRTQLAGEAVESSSPRAIMDRGYSIVTDEDGKVVKNADALADRQLINIEAAKGRATARVER